MEDSTFGPAGANADLECQIYVAAPSRDRLMERLAAALNVSLGPLPVLINREVTR
ncbi:hypothetical protein [Streptomyces mexicanus]|uniref:Uncharacterized protein n=1 Tax=Streptomyces mexicanus TaxID=178566 RepID=A0A7X1LQR7_9ACTN|nr:hypothetical protein [Streptomyces mexicanus]MBC2866365.1 hypothetical protein [Streptomyces mexicanus]